MEPSMRYVKALRPDDAEEFLLVAKEELARKPPLSTKDLPGGGHDILPRLGERSRRLVGDILRALLEEAIEDPASATRDALLGRIDALIADSP